MDCDFASNYRVKIKIFRIRVTIHRSQVKKFNNFEQKIVQPDDPPLSQKKNNVDFYQYFTIKKALFKNRNVVFLLVIRNRSYIYYVTKKLQSLKKYPL